MEDAGSSVIGNKNSSRDDDGNGWYQVQVGRRRVVQIIVNSYYTYAESTYSDYTY